MCVHSMDGWRGRVFWACGEASKICVKYSIAYLAIKVPTLTESTSDQPHHGAQVRKKKLHCDENTEIRSAAVHCCEEKDNSSVHTSVECLKSEGCHDVGHVEGAELIVAVLCVAYMLN